MITQEFLANPPQFPDAEPLKILRIMSLNEGKQT